MARETRTEKTSRPIRKQLLVFRPGEAARNLSRWQFAYHEDGNGSGAIITTPRPRVSWRYARIRHVQISFSKPEGDALIQSVENTFARFENACLKNEDLWVDASEVANAITRDKLTNALCLTMTLAEGRNIYCNYSLPETSPILLQAKFYLMITQAIKPHLSDGGERQS